MKINKAHLLYAFFFFICLKPFGINYYNILDNAMNVAKIIMFAYYFLFYCISICTGKIKRFKCTNILILLYLAVTIPTIVYNGDYFRRIMEMASTVMLSIFIEKNKKDIGDILTSWFWVITLYMPINLLSIASGAVAFEESMAIYFLGSKNTWGSLLPIYCFIIYYVYQKNNKTKKYAQFALILMAANVIVTRSTTAMVELVILAFFWLLKDKKLIRKISGYWLLLSIYAALNLALLSSAWWGNIIGYLDAYFSKGSFSFTARTRMWQAGIDLFLSHPLFGVGKLTEKVWTSNILGVGYHTQLHNQIVEYLATGGLCLFGIYVVLLILAGKNLQKYHVQGIAYFMIISIFLQNIGVLTEAKYFAEFYVLFILSFYIEFLLADRKKV